MTSEDATLMAVLATAYVARMRAAHRPEWLVLAFLRLVRVLKVQLQAEGSKAVGNRQVRLAIAALAASLVRYVSQQVPSAPPGDNTQAGNYLHAKIATAVTKAQKETSGPSFAQRVALIVIAETQLATIALTQDAAAAAPAPVTISRSTTSEHPCEECEAAEGDYTPPYPDELFWSHPNCCCEWSAS